MIYGIIVAHYIGSSKTKNINNLPYANFREVYCILLDDKEK